MGSFNYFKNLKDHGTKLSKFKQDTLLPLMSSRGIEFIKYTSEGICFPLTMLWLKTQQLSPAYLSRDKDKLHEHLNHTKQAAKFLNHAGDLSQYQMNYRAQNEGTTNFDAFMYLFKLMELKPHPELGGQKAMAEAFPFAMNICWGSGCLGVFLSLDCKGTTHAIAFVKAGKMIRFFDPNVGEYEVEPAKIAAFFTEWAKVYAVQFNKVWTSALVIGVIPATA